MDLNLKDTAEEIYNNKLVLPNFQREYVWNEKEKQIGFLASILARIPLGNIITFKDDKNSFACKPIGSIGDDNHLDTREINDEQVNFLLDGQQRITTLLLIFSNRLFYDKDRNYDSKTNKKFFKRFFLKLPNADTEQFISDTDVFGLLKLTFPFSKFPNFCSNDLYDGDSSEILEIVSLNKSDKVWYHPEKDLNEDTYSLITSAVNENKIPLFWLLDNNNLIRQVLLNIASKRKQYLIYKYGSSGNGDKKELNKELSLGIKEKEILGYSDEKLENRLTNKVNEWADAMANYLRDCITNLKVNKFSVTEEGQERAIDIYEALNKGGVPLSTFDLIIARAAKNLNNKNLNSILKEKVKSYYNKNLLHFLKTNIKTWSAEDLGVINKDSIQESVVKQFLSLMCIVSNIQIGKMRNTLTPDYCKDRKQLKMTPEQISENAEKCMESIIDALMYLNIKQGVYSLGCIHYKLTLLPIAYCFYVAKLNGYSFEDTDIKRNNFIINIINAWYKMAVFTDFYQLNQTARTIEFIKEFDDLLCKNIMPKYFTDDLDKRKELVLNVPHYNDLKMLLFDDSGYTLSNAITIYITQYYLSNDSAIDILKRENKEFHISSYSNDLKFEIHHFIPLYADKSLNTKISEKTSDFRNSQQAINSPLNKIIITKESNRKIGTMLPTKYRNEIPDAYFYINDFSTDTMESDTNKIVTLDYLEKVYRHRYNNLVIKLKKDIQDSVDIIKEYIENQ